MMQRPFRLNEASVPLPRGTRVVPRSDYSGTDGFVHRTGTLAPVRELKPASVPSLIAACCPRRRLPGSCRRCRPDARPSCGPHRIARRMPTTCCACCIRTCDLLDDLAQAQAQG